MTGSFLIGFPFSLVPDIILFPPLLPYVSFSQLHRYSKREIRNKLWFV
jgi:hypothetical protein